MDILFINPRTELEMESKIYHREPPNGLLTLCAIVENAGYDVDFFDLSVQSMNKLQRYLSEEPRLVGITSLTNTYNIAMDISDKVKEISPNTKIMYGGPHATFKYAEILQQNKNVDYILCGEADQTLLQFVQRFFESENPDYTRLPNLAYRVQEKMRYIESYTPVNLDDLPLPARHLLDLENYEVGMIIVNRGCPFNCAFCVRQKIFRKVRFRNPNDVAFEMQILTRLGFKFVNLYDNLNVNEDYVLKLCQKIKETKLNLNWGSELRADRISIDLATALREAGCKVIAVGIESGDPKVLQQVNKQQNLESVKKGIKNAKSAGLAIQAYFIIGLPGETLESFELTCKLLDDLSLEPGIDRVNFFAATPYPGTALYEHPEKFGVQIRHENWDLYDNSNLIMELDSITFEDLEKNFKKGKEIEKEFYSSLG
ncbi:MAG TPA: radical SAM protein [Candidatus Deferrimicrobium sp.]|nr:radical SAM protein [Candidatus Deferrimicrobium sp.]